MDPLSIEYGNKRELQKELDAVISRITELESINAQENQRLESNGSTPTEKLQICLSSLKTLRGIIQRKSEHIEIYSGIAKCESNISGLYGEKHGLKLGFWMGFGLAVCLSISVVQIF